MAIMESVLAKKRFIAGDRLTVGDIALAPAIHRWLNLPLKRLSRPHVERWYGEIMRRPRTGESSHPAGGLRRNFASTMRERKDRHEASRRSRARTRPFLMGSALGAAAFPRAAGHRLDP